MLQRHNNSLTLPTVRLVLGIIAIVLSLIFSIQFVAAGSSGSAIIGAILFCLITEFCKTVFTGDLFFYWETGQGSKTLFSAVIVVVLFALSISAAVFVLSISPAKQTAMIETADTRIESLQKAISAKQSQIAACNPAYVSKCLNPRNNELNALQSELDSVLSQSGGAAIMEAKANAEFWKKAADYLGTKPDSLQLNFAIARAVLLDLLGLILVSQYTSSRRINNAIEGVYSHDNAMSKPDSLPAENAALIENMKLLKQIQDLKAELEKKQ